MTIPATDRKAGPLLGNGAQTSWPFTFKVFAAADIQVTVANVLGVETLLTLGTDYTVTLNGDQQNSPGGTVTYPITGSPLAAGGRLTITGYVDFDQQLDLPEGGNFSPAALENQLDRIVMQVQQLRESINRAVQVGVTTDVAVTLPPPAPSRLIAWNQDGTGLQNVPLQDLATGVAFVAYRYDVFTGDGVSTSFPLTEDPTVIGNVYVTVGGVGQLPVLDFNLINGSLDFTTAPPVGAKVLAHYGEAPSGTNPTGAPVTFVPTVQSLSGDGTTTAFTLNNNPGSAAALVIRISGAVQTPGTDFNVSGTTLTFTDAPPAGTGNIVVQDFGAAVPVGAASASSVAYLDSTKLDQYLGPASGSAALRMDLATGNLGLGGAPGVKFDVLGADGVRARVLASAGGTAGLLLSSAGATAYAIKAGNGDSSLRFDQDGYDILRLTRADGLRLYGATSGFVGLAAPASGGSATFTLPGTAGTNGQFLTTNGSGTLSWSSLILNAISSNDSNITVNDSGANSTFTFALDGTTVGTWNNRILGIGITPNAGWGSSYRGVEGPGWALAGFSSNYLELVQNGYNNGTSWLAKNTGYLTQYTSTNGTQVFAVSSGSVTAGGAVGAWVELINMGNGTNPVVGLSALAISQGNTQFNVNNATQSITGSGSIFRYTTTNCTVTLPNPSTWRGRLLFLSNITANSVSSASSNVCPLGSDTAGTAILPATAGKFAILASDPTSATWKIIAAN